VGAPHLHIGEKKDIPKTEKHRPMMAHGFHREIVTMDFPLRGRSVFRHIKRRPWFDGRTKAIVQSDYPWTGQTP